MGLSLSTSHYVHIKWQVSFEDSVCFYHCVWPFLQLALSNNGTTDEDSSNQDVDCTTLNAHRLLLTDICHSDSAETETQQPFQFAMGEAER